MYMHILVQKVNLIRPNKCLIFPPQLVTNQSASFNFWKDWDVVLLVSLSVCLSVCLSTACMRRAVGLGLSLSVTADVTSRVNSAAAIQAVRMDNGRSLALSLAESSWWILS